jgi:AraC family transcriptional regulator
MLPAVPRGRKPGLRTASRDRYLRGIDRVVERLSQCIAGEEPLPGIPELARHAHLSEFHFMRIYRALAGESPGATIQRLRLERAARLLAESSLRVTDVAVLSGYQTAQAFATAFRKRYGVAPGDVRRNPARFAEGALAPRGRREPDAPPPVVDVAIVALEPFRVAALRNHGDYADLDKAYGVLFRWVAGHGALEAVSAIWGIPYHDRRDDPPAECVFDCCLAISAPLAGDAQVSIERIGGGHYAMCRHTGSYDGLDELHDAMLRRMVDEGLALRDAPILHHYLDDPEVTPEADLEAHIYIPIVQEKPSCGS